MGNFNKKTIRDIELAGKRVLLRADYNVPVNDGRITDDYRLKASLPTVDYILQQKPASLTIISHLGRPDGTNNKELSLRPVAEHLSKLLAEPVRFVNDCLGEQVQLVAGQLKDGQILMLENLRFHPEEEKNNENFAKAIIKASSAEVFVQDGFGVVHRAHASTDAITKLLPSVAGLLLEKEVETITQVMDKPDHPLVAVIGGAKVSDKIDILEKFITTAECLAIGGAMANDFLVAAGTKVGKSLTELQTLPEAHRIIKLAKAESLKRPFSFLLPIDVVVSSDIHGRAPTRIVDLSTDSLADIEAYPKPPPKKAYTVGEDELILDIGPISAAYIAGAIKMARTVVWNGSLGVTETKGIAGADAPFTHATNLIINAMIGDSHKHQNKPYTLVGGGDTVGFIEAEGLVDDFDFVSTGGGASLELMGGKKLPGIEALPDKKQ